MKKADLAACFFLILSLAAAPPAGLAVAQPSDAPEAREDGDGEVLSEAEMLLAGAQANRIDILLHLLGKGVDPDARVRGGYTALIAASSRGSTDAIELLLARGADVNLANDEGWTPLMEALAREREDTAERLLRAGAGVNAREKRRGSTPLMIAARTDIPGLTTLLLTEGADANAADSEDGVTALHLALASDGLKSVETVGELLVGGADAGKPAKDGYTPLMSAAESGMTDKLGLILSEKVDVNAATDDGRTALVVAAGLDKPELVRQLLDAGASAAPEGSRISPLAEAMRAGSLESARLLMRAGADPNRPDRDGKTPLILAVLGGQDALVEELLGNEADPNGRNAEDGTTPLMWAANTGRKSYVDLLLERGADAGLEANDGWTAGEAARMAGHEEIARILERRI